MPCPSQCCYYLPDDGLVASSTTSLGGGGDTLFIHISLKVAEHRIQLVFGAVGSLDLVGFCVGGVARFRLGLASSALLEGGERSHKDVEFLGGRRSSRIILLLLPD